MATLAEKAQVMSDPGFQNRCMMAGIEAAWIVLAEPGDAPLRKNFASAYILSPQDHAAQVIGTVATDDPITDAEIAAPGSAPDGDIVARLLDKWNALCGASN